MIDALQVLDADETIDVIVLARGGGCIEDLLPFSDEALCRAVFACRTPVVTAIGHETDTPLVDYVADVRASTPTDAAKRIVPDLAEELRLIEPARQRLDRAVRAPARPRAAAHRRAARRARCWPGPHAACSTSGPPTSPRCATGPPAAWTTGCAGADGELRHTAGPAARAVPGRDAGARVRDRAARRRPRASARPATWPTGDPLRVRLAEGELAAKVDRSWVSTAT